MYFSSLENQTHGAGWRVYTTYISAGCVVKYYPKYYPAHKRVFRKKVGNRCDSIYWISRRLRLSACVRASLSFLLNRRYLGRLSRECQLSVSKSWHVRTHIRNLTVARDRRSKRRAVRLSHPRGGPSISYEQISLRYDETMSRGRADKMAKKGDNVFSVQYPQIILSSIRIANGLSPFCNSMFVTSLFRLIKRDWKKWSTSFFKLVTTYAFNFPIFNNRLYIHLVFSERSYTQLQR